MNQRDILQKGLRFHQLTLNESKQCKLLRLINLLEKWNKIYNLTAIRDKQEMVTRHLLDSLSALTFIKDQHTIADLGSGGGFPGIPLAICEPEKKFTLIDSNSKKTRFLAHAKIVLSLNNVEILNCRIEQIEQIPLFDCLISRAFASPENTISRASHLIKSEGLLILMMGHANRGKIENLNSFALKKVVPVQIYNEQSTRHVVTFVKTLDE